MSLGGLVKRGRGDRSKVLYLWLVKTEVKERGELQGGLTKSPWSSVVKIAKILLLRKV